MISLRGGFDKKKFKKIVLYLVASSRGGRLRGKKKLAKLLYFADFDFYEKYEQKLTGATYRAMQMGPLPDELELVLKEMEGDELDVKIEKTGLENDVNVYSLKTKFEPSFSKEEKEVLDSVIKKYLDETGLKLQEISHAEAPFNAVIIGEEIPYELSFYRGNY